MTDHLDNRPAVVWFRRDLRLDDNPAWAAATAAHRDVIALFVIEPALMEASGQIRRDQLLGHLHSLDDEFRSRGGALAVRGGPARSAIPQAIRDGDASALYYNADAGTFAVGRDRAVRAAVSVPVHVSHGLTVHEPGTVVTGAGTLAQVFTPFYKAWRARRSVEWPSEGPGKPAVLAGLPIPMPQRAPRHESGAAAAWERLARWNADVDHYPATRDRPALDGTSDLSADLKFGTLAARTVVDVIGTTSEGREAFVRQIAWRDWWAHMLTARPDLALSAVKPQYDHIQWRDDSVGFDRWCAGTTGYPIVDAGMRQLVQTGWMHGRVRMICASFLVKDLLIDWRRGERFFRHHLVDADVAQNAGNWQWVAGTGPDAAPYFRVFNPTMQSKKFDPGGDYIRRWVPELGMLSEAAIHEPSATAPLDLVAANVVLGDTYPLPLVDHRAARLRALDTYKRGLAAGLPRA